MAAEVVKLLGNLQRGSEFNFTATTSEAEEEEEEEKKWMTGALPPYYQPLTLLIHKFSQQVRQKVSVSSVTAEKAHTSNRVCGYR